MGEIIRSEWTITNNEKCRFLIELLLTDDWSEEFNFMVEVHNTYIGSPVKLRFADYMHSQGLVKDARNNE